MFYSSFLDCMIGISFDHGTVNMLSLNLLSMDLQTVGTNQYVRKLAVDVSIKIGIQSNKLKIRPTK